MIPYNLNQSSLSKIHFSLSFCGAGSFLSCFSNSDVKLWPDTNEHWDGEILYFSALFFHPATAPFSLIIAQMHYQTLYRDFIFMQNQFSPKKDPIFTANQNIAGTEMYKTYFFFDSWRPCVLTRSWPYTSLDFLWRPNDLSFLQICTLSIIGLSREACDFGLQLMKRK